MIAYTTVGTNDYPKATAFYDALLGEMGAKRLWQDKRFASYGVAMDQPMFAVCTPDNGATATSGNGAMVTLSCSNTEMVHTLHSKALELGGSCEGKPGPRGDTGFYISYFRDLDGNKLAAFTMVPPTG